MKDFSLRPAFIVLIIATGQLANEAFIGNRGLHHALFLISVVSLLSMFNTTNPNVSEGAPSRFPLKNMPVTDAKGSQLLTPPFVN